MIGGITLKKINITKVINQIDDKYIIEALNNNYQPIKKAKKKVMWPIIASLIGVNIIILFIVVIGYQHKELNHTMNTNRATTMKNTIVIEKFNNDIATLAIKKNSLSNIGLTLIITNKVEETLSFSDAYYLESYEDKHWQRLSEGENYATSMPPNYHLPSKKKMEIIYNWSERYGVLKKGKYRLVKDIDAKKVSLEFIIE